MVRLEDYKPRSEKDTPVSSKGGLELVHAPIAGDIFHELRARASGGAASVMCWLLAAVAHAAVIAGLSFAIEPDIAGASGSTLDALGVEVAIVSASALDARRQETTETSAGSDRYDEHDGATANKASPPERPEKEQEAEPPPVIQAKPDPSLDQAEVQIVVAEQKQEEKRDEKKPEETQDNPTRTSSTSSVQTGSFSVTSSENAESQPRQAAVAASPGTVNRYARSIADVLAKSRPKLTTARSKGTVKIAFAVAEDGRPEFVRVTSSSGNKHLDDVALNAISSSAFPPPPPGMTLGQRTYEIPYFFR